MNHAHVLALACIAFANGSSLYAQQLVDIGTLGGNYSAANGINDLNQVVGQADTGDSAGHAFLYSNGTMTDLGTWGGNQSDAYGINNSGTIVGYSYSSSSGDTAILYSNGISTNLGPGYAQSINNSGQIVGTSSATATAFLYSNGITTNLGVASGYNTSEAYSINDSGVVAGTSTTYNGTGAAFIYSGGVMTNLGSLGGYSSYAFGINNSGQVVGQSLTGSLTLRAYLYSGGTMTNLGTLSGGFASFAVSINDVGAIVGSAFTTSNGNDHAFIYTPTTGLEDLNTLYSSLLVSGTGAQEGFTSLTNATAINNNGYVVGNGVYWDGSELTTQAFLLDTQASPEPSTWWLVSEGLLLIGGLRFRQRLQSRTYPFRKFFRARQHRHGKGHKTPKNSGKSG